MSRRYRHQNCFLGTKTYTCRSGAPSAQYLEWRNEHPGVATMETKTEDGIRRFIRSGQGCAGSDDSKEVMLMAVARHSSPLWSRRADGDPGRLPDWSPAGCVDENWPAGLPGFNHGRLSLSAPVRTESEPGDISPKEAGRIRNAGNLRFLASLFPKPVRYMNPETRVSGQTSPCTRGIRTDESGRTLFRVILLP